jgi:hypothetical protein
MKKISQSQIKILRMILAYNAKDFTLAPYLSSIDFNLGFHHMNFWRSKKNIFKFIFAFFKEIYSIMSASDYEIKGNLSNLSNFKSIVVTWGNDDSTKNNLYYDKSFNSSSKDNSILWVVIYSGKKVFFNNNVIGIIKTKISFYRRFKNFFFFFLSLFEKKKNLHKFTYNYFLAKKFGKIFNKIIKGLKLTNDCKFFLPYESQPFQNNLIKIIKTYKKEVKIFGYIHSFPAFPSHLVKKTINPDFLILNSKDQVYSFKKYLKWKDKDIIFLPSLRFKKLNNPSNLMKKIFLPINFHSVEGICNKISDLNKIYNLKEFDIKNHPVAKNSKKHLKLINEIKKIIYFNGNSRLSSNVSIFIGPTGAIIEALNNGVEPIHIMENIEFEIYSQKLWPSIKSKFIKDKIVNYKLLKKNIINTDNNLTFDYYLKLD